MARYDWKNSMSETDEDISKYLEKRYEDYCRDIGDYSENGKDWYKNQDRKKHWDKQDRLIEFGFKLKDKMSNYPEEMKKDLFEKMISTHEKLDKFYIVKYNDFCMELEKIDNSYDSKQQEKKKKHKELLKQKEIMGQSLFIESADESMISLKKSIKERKKKEAEEEIKRKKEAEEKAKRNVLNERRQGHSNVKPLSFYEEKYVYSGNEKDYIDEDDYKCYIEEKQEEDAYFEEHGIPKGEWIKDGTCFIKEDNSNYKYPEIIIHTLADSPEENQKHLNRCKELKKIIDALLLQDYMQRHKWLQDCNLFDVEILQKYLTNGYLVTIQITSLVYRILYWLTYLLAIDINKPHRLVENCPAIKYRINVYSNDFDIRKIKEDIAEFARINEGKILTPLECLKVYLKKHDNRITIIQYAKFIDNTNIVARRILNNFYKEKKLKRKKEGSSHELVYFV